MINSSLRANRPDSASLSLYFLFLNMTLKDVDHFNIISSFVWQVDLVINMSEIMSVNDVVEYKLRYRDLLYSYFYDYSTKSSEHFIKR